jgi:hypothetical protein
MAEKRKEDKTLLWLYANDKQNDKQPDYTGPGRINKDVLKELVDAYKKYGDEDGLKLRAASWKKDSREGTPYLFVTIEVERPKPSEDADDEIPF